MTKTEECQFDFIEDGEWFCAIHDCVMIQHNEPVHCAEYWTQKENDND